MIPEEVSSISDQFKGLKAIHYVGELGKKLHNPNVYQGEGNQQNDDGVFRLCIFFLTEYNLSTYSVDRKMPSSA